MSDTQPTPFEAPRQCGGCRQWFAGPPTMEGARCPNCNPRSISRPLKAQHMRVEVAE